jgi:hypothetical protein
LSTLLIRIAYARLVQFTVFLPFCEFKHLLLTLTQLLQLPPVTFQLVLLEAYICIQLGDLAREMEGLSLLSLDLSLGPTLRTLEEGIFLLQPTELFMPLLNILDLLFVQLDHILLGLSQLLLSI